mgnify:CR=1 FL=1
MDKIERENLEGELSFLRKVITDIPESRFFEKEGFEHRLKEILRMLGEGNQDAIIDVSKSSTGPSTVNKNTSRIIEQFFLYVDRLMDDDESSIRLGYDSGLNGGNKYNVFIEKKLSNADFVFGSQTSVNRHELESVEKFERERTLLDFVFQKGIGEDDDVRLMKMSKARAAKKHALKLLETLEEIVACNPETQMTDKDILRFNLIIEKAKKIVQEIRVNLEVH